MRNKEVNVLQDIIMRPPCCKLLRARRHRRSEIPKFLERLHRLLIRPKTSDPFLRINRRGIKSKMLKKCSNVDSGREATVHVNRWSSEIHEKFCSIEFKGTSSRFGDEPFDTVSWIQSKES